MSNKENQNEQWMLLVLLLKQIALDKEITQDKIAEDTGYTQSNISRFFSLRFTPSMAVFLNIAKAVGVNFFIDDKSGTTDLNVCFENAMASLGRRADKLNKN